MVASAAAKNFGQAQKQGALIVICGPTAAGKSGLAMAIAQRLNTVILSADSRQVYREFDIGTAKPSDADRCLVPHFLIDLCDPTETLTLADYQQQAQAIIAKLHGASGSSQHLEGTGMPPLLVGGTGLYIRSIVRGLKIPRVPPHPELRSQLQSLGQPQCYDLLLQVDPDAASKIHPNDQTRTLRALEVFYVTGLPISHQQGEAPPSYPILQIGLDCESPEGLTRRIQQRTHQMVAQGFVDEVSRLCTTYGTDLPLLNTLGYQEMRHHLAGDRTLQEAIDDTILHTRQFAKRQRTWFRADPTIHWFDAEAPDVLQQVEQTLQFFLDTLHI